MKTEIKVGLVGLGVLILLFFGIKFLKGIDIFNKEVNYYVLYKDVSGMHQSNYIYLNGMKVGYIKSIKAMDNRAENFLVTISISSKVNMTKDSKIVLFNADMLGSKALRLELGQGELLHKGDTIKGEREVGMLDKLGTAITPMAENLDSILSATKSILNQQNRDNIQRTLANLESTSRKLNELSRQFDGLVDSEKSKIRNIIANTESITSNLKDNNERLSNIISRIDQITDTVAQANIGSTLSETSRTIERLNKVLGIIENGKGNLGLLINDEGLYRNLSESAKKLDALIEDIKANPKKYVKISVF